MGGRRLAACGLLLAGLLVLAPATPSGADGNEAPGNPVAFRQVSLGSDHACAILTGGTVRCWGRNDQGQLGVGDTDNRGDNGSEMGSALVNVPLGNGRSAVQISVGTFHSCALLDNGQVKCWGGSEFGQLGTGNTTDKLGDGPNEMGDNLPPIDLGPGRTATFISTSANHTCAILDTGDLKCWGANFNGQLGLDDTDNRGDEPAEMGNLLPAVDLDGADVATVSVSATHTCVVLTTGQVKCWGDNVAGRLGLGNTQRQGDNNGEMEALPFVALGAGRTATAISAGGSSTCALLNNASVACWGSGFQAGQGDGFEDIGDEPGEMGNALLSVDLGTGETAVAITTGFAPCAILGDGQLKCWGSGTFGVSGHGDTVSRGDDPDEMGDDLPAVDLGTGRTATAVVSSLSSNCARLDDGNLKCWGANFFGQLGQGDTNSRGDGPNEMGNFLPPIDLGTPPAPTCDGQVVTVDLNQAGVPTAGNDVILGTPGPDTINALGGADRVCAGGGVDTVNGGSGADRLFGQAGNDTLRGGTENDRLDGGSEVDRLFGDAGLDTLLGQAGNDTLTGGTQNDTATGGAGNDHALGNDGNDTLNGSAGADTLDGGNQNDRLNGGTQNDTCHGRAGTDSQSGCETRTGIP